MLMPLWIIAIYGFIERLVIVLLIYTIADINRNNKNIIMISLLSVAFTIFCRYFFNYFTFVAIINAFIVIILIKIFNKNSNIYKIMKGTIITFIIVLIIESIMGYIVFTNYMHINYYIVWILTGIPHIAIMILVIYKIRNSKNEKYYYNI